MTKEEFKQARTTLGLTQTELGHALGYTTFIPISKKENGHFPISASDEIIIKILLTKPKKRK